MNLNLPETERKILRFWKKNKIFEKTLKKTRKGPKFVFYEGPPFANGLPGIHHLLARAFKDVILRYKTMRGFFVERKAGWDTHGLPTELEAEKKLGIKSKKEIEADIEKFIVECKNNVFTYKKEWEEFTRRIGFWLDLEKAYITCSNDYIESLWWILKQIWEKGFLYQDYKVVPYCPRCGTSLSSHEVALGYKSIKENSLYVKFKLKTQNSKYLLVWTTTPWTLPGNAAIAVNPKVDYVEVSLGSGEIYILAKNRLNSLKNRFNIIKETKGKNLVGLEYEPLIGFAKTDKLSFRVVAADFVSTEEGTGLVHIAPAFGEDDMRVGKENNLPVLLTVDEEGKFKSEIKSWAGTFVKKADPLIVKYLKRRNLLFREELYEHDYPFCWRCDSPLLYYAKQSWFIKVTAVKKELIKNNKKINWMPDYLKEGRFGEWLNEVKDWNLSRERYWGTPLPVWQCEKCQKRICIGSVAELNRKANLSLKIKDLHRPYIDKIIIKCDCSGKMKRLPEVIDCWFDSGAMPFAQQYYPFNPDSLSRQSSVNYGAKNKKSSIILPKKFPADFICEGIDQTRGWFYTLLVISTLLGLGISYKNVVSHGIVLDARGQKMSKSKGNVVRPSEVIDKYGADAVRFYFYTANPVGEPKRFDFKDVQTLYRRFFDTLINIQNFFATYSEKKFRPKDNFKSSNLLDRWVISCSENLNAQIIEKLDNYDTVGAARLIDNFVDDLSNWYVRRSRKRFQKPQIKKEKEDAVQTLNYILLKLTGLLAPFTPFLSDYLYKNLRGRAESVHLTEYPLPVKKLIDNKLEEKMKKIKDIISLALAERARSGIRVRQPLAELKITNYELKKEKDLLELIEGEVNVKKITFGKKLKLDTKITFKLKEEGLVREFIRNVQEMRKKAGLRPEDKILARYSGSDDLNKILTKNKKFILSEGKIKNLILGDMPKEVFKVERELKVDGKKLWLAIKKIK